MIYKCDHSVRMIHRPGMLKLRMLIIRVITNRELTWTMLNS